MFNHAKLQSITFKFAFHALELVYWRIINPWMYPLLGRSSIINSYVMDLSMRALGYRNANSRINGELDFLDLVLDKFVSISSEKQIACVDVGANLGDWSRYVLRASEARVVMIEPIPSLALALRDLEQLFPGRVKIFNLGASNFEGRSTFFEYPEHREHSNMYKEVNSIEYLKFNKVMSFKIEVDTLDHIIENSLLEDDFDFLCLKIDVEGGEFEVLQGCKQTLTKTPPKFVQIEFNRHHLYRNHSLLTFSNLLEGYTVYQLVEKRFGLLRKRDPNKPESNFYEYSNFVFVRSDLVSKLETFLGDL